MVIANITSFIGQCGGAEHYYCEYKVLNEPIYKPDKIRQVRVSSHDEVLYRTLDLKEREYLTKKNNCNYYPRSTNKFNNYEEIFSKLKEQFPDTDIITFKEGDIFSEMLCIVNGEDKTYKYFGEVWSELPTSLYEQYIPKDVRIRCEDCHHEYTLEEVIKEKRPWNDKVLVGFNKHSRDFKNVCCKNFYLEWNGVI